MYDYSGGFVCLQGLVGGLLAVALYRASYGSRYLYATVLLVFYRLGGVLSTFLFHVVSGAANISRGGVDLLFVVHRLMAS